MSTCCRKHPAPHPHLALVAEASNCPGLEAALGLAAALVAGEAAALEAALRLAAALLVP
jgi:hypothetical protein